MKSKVLRTVSGPTFAILALAASLLAMMVVLSTTANAETPAVEINVAGEADDLTTLIVVGNGSRSVSYDGAIARFKVTVVRDSALEARQAGSVVVSAIKDAIDEHCTTDEPATADHTAAPTCISPKGLQTVGFRLGQQWDWTEAGRVLRGWEYEYRLQIAIRGTGFAGGLVDLVIGAGGDSLHFDDLDFTASGEAEAEREALLDAITDARATAASIAEHMRYEIVRIVELSPVGAATPYPAVEARAFAADEEAAYEPTQVFAGTQSVIRQVRMVFELRPLPEVADE